MYKFRLDGKKLTTTPKGWEKFTQTITRSIAQRRITFDYPTDLVFYGDGFQILWDAVNSYGYDKVFEFRAEKDDSDGFISSQVFGVIFMIDVEFDVVKRTATARVKENGFVARMLGNVNNPIALPSLETKNGLTLLGQSSTDTEKSNSRISLSFSTVALGGLGLAHPGFRKAVDVFDALKEMVLNMSDNKLTLESNWFDSQLADYLEGGDKYKAPLCLIKGRELRLGTDRTTDHDFAISISWDKLFTAVARIYNLYYYPNTEQQPPVIKIGDEDDFFPLNGPTAKIESPDNMKLGYFQELFFSTVKLGSGSYLYTDGNTATNLPDVQWQTFKGSEYVLTGDSNLDIQKDLSIPGFIVDSNIIRDVLVNDNTSYDDQYFLIQYTPKAYTLDLPFIGVTEYARAVSFELFKDELSGNGLPMFNGALISSEVAKNHNFFGKITQSLSDVLIDNRCKYEAGGSDKYSFIAEEGTQYFPPPFVPKYSAAVFDYSDGQFNEVTAIYTAKFNGMYEIDSFLKINVTALKSTQQLLLFGISTSYELKDVLRMGTSLIVRSGTNVLEQKYLANTEINATGEHTRRSETSVWLNANETIEISIQFTAYNKTSNSGKLKNNIEWQYEYGSYFHVKSTPNLSLTYSDTEQTDEYRATRVILNHYLSEDQLKNVLSNPERPIILSNFVEFGASKKCWIKQLKINRETTEIEAELITNIANEKL